MLHAGRNPVLSRLRALVEQVERGSRAREVLPFGLRSLDRYLPSGGLQLGALHEVAGASFAVEDAAPPISFIAGVLARIPGAVLWCLPRRDLFAPGLACLGLAPERVIWVETWNRNDVLLLMEEGLRTPGLAGVVGEFSTRKLALVATRRLQLAAEGSGVTGFILRRGHACTPEALAASTAAVTRWRVAASPSKPLPVPGIGRARWQLDLLRCRGADPISWIVDACDAQGRLSLPAHMADRPPAPETQQAAAG